MTDCPDVGGPRQETHGCLGTPEAQLPEAPRHCRGRHDLAGMLGTEDVVMTDEHVMGTLNRALRTVEEGLGKVAGSKQDQARGKARQVDGSAQKGLGDVRTPSESR